MMRRLSQGWALPATIASPGDALTSQQVTDLLGLLTEPVIIEVALSGSGAAVAAGTGKGWATAPIAGNVTGFAIYCSPNAEPSALQVEVDLNKVAGDGTVTTLLSAVAAIAVGANTGTGTIDGTQAVTAGTQFQLDVDQGDVSAQELRGVITITPT